MSLQFVNIHHQYTSQKILKDVSFTVDRGEIVCLLGPSGSGKSTLLRIAAGLERQSQGEVWISGKLVAGPSFNAPPEKRGVGFLFQDYALFPHLNVRENVGFGLKGWAKSEKAQRIAELLAQVEMEWAEDSYPHALSGGQQQRVALARALAPRPQVILLDEPFSGLDTALREQVRDETLHLLKNSGVAILMVTHDPEEAMFMSDRIILLNQGQIAQEGEPYKLYCTPVSAFVANFFGELNRFQTQVGEDGNIMTALGTLRTKEFPPGTKVELFIRPEGLRLDAKSDAEQYPQAQVIAARHLGRSSLIHLRTLVDNHHFHARMSGRFLPASDELLTVRLDPAQVFIFPI